MPREPLLESSEEACAGTERAGGVIREFAEEDMGIARIHKK